MNQTELILNTSLQCKNCEQPVHHTDKFCSNCSAKIISERITFKNLMYDLFRNTLGWDNKYLYTIKSLVANPGQVLNEYIDGTRKKYVQPFTFLAIGMTIAIFVFNTFDEEYLTANHEFQKSQLTWMGENFGTPFASAEFQKEQLESSKKSTKIMLKYFNILVVLLLPIYSFIAFLVYRKPYNFGEHIVINSYVQGLSFLSISILFLVSLVTHPLVYAANIILLICFYTYAYAKLYKLSIVASILKVIVFFAIVGGSLFVLFISAVVIGLLSAYLNS